MLQKCFAQIINHFATEYVPCRTFVATTASNYRKNYSYLIFYTILNRKIIFQAYKRQQPRGGKKTH